MTRKRKLPTPDEVEAEYVGLTRDDLVPVTTADVLREFKRTDRLRGNRKRRYDQRKKIIVVNRW